MKPLSEKQFQAAVVQAAKLHHWLVYFTWSSRHSPAGFPDLICLKGPVVRVYELKTETGRIRPEQDLWITAFNNAGIPARVIRPSDMDEVLAELQGQSVHNAAEMHRNGPPRHETT